MLKYYVKSKMALEDMKKNIEGASLIEYSILIGLITAAVVGIIVIIGGRVETWWEALSSATAPASNAG